MNDKPEIVKQYERRRDAGESLYFDPVELEDIFHYYAEDGRIDKFVEDRDRKLELRASGCGICEMEIAGIARVCERSGVKCLSVKCISDTFDGDGGDFNTNVRKSAVKAFGAIREVLKAL